MTRYPIHQSGQDNWQPSKPMNECARFYKHGPIEPIDEPRSLLECFGWGFLYAVITAVPITFILIGA